jgi:hypothetical protein
VAETHDDVFLTLLKTIERAKPKNVSEAPNTGYERERTDLDCRRQEVQIEGDTQDIIERKKYASRFYRLACVWVSIIAVLLLCEGFGSIIHFSLSDSVLLAAIGSTTANILGILYVVATYLFKKR